MPFQFITNFTNKIGSLLSRSAENTGNHISKWVSHGRLGGLINYREADYDELVKVQLQFVEHIDKTISPILDINAEKKSPKASEHEISSCFIYDRYDNRGDLRDLMKYLSTLIKACVNARFSAAETKGYNHINGAAILCCAEMAIWINKMAKTSIDEEMLSQITKRIRYLESLLENDIFQNEPKTDYAMDRLIFNMISILEKLVKPQIQAELTELSAREYFKALVKESKTAFQQISSGLYSLYSNQSKEVTELFNVEASSIIVHETYEEGMNSNLGRLFKSLSKYYQQNISSSAFNQLMLECKNNNQEEEILQPLKDNNNFRTNGIHLLIYKKPELLDHLVKFVDLLKQFALLITTFRQSYVLAGNGGDILIYIGLCQEINNITACYFRLRGQLRQKISDILKLAGDIMLELIQNQDKSPWRAQYINFKSQIEIANSSLEICDTQINNILMGMMRVSSRDFAEEVLDKIENLRNTLDLIQYKLGMQSQIGSSARVSPVESPRVEELPPATSRPQLTSSNNPPLEALLERQKQQRASLQRRIENSQTTQPEQKKEIVTPKNP